MASQPGQSGTLPPAYTEKEQLAQQQAAQQNPAAYPPQGQLWQQGYPMPQAAMQMPATAFVQPPAFPGPHNFLMLALVTTILCGILNLISLAFGVPAIVLAVLSMNAKNSKDYPQAKRYGRNALILTILNIIFTMLLTMLIVGLITGFVCADPYNYDSYYFSYGCGRHRYYY